MKTGILNNQTIAQALELGFDFNDYSEETTLEELDQFLMDFFHENSEKLEQVEDECEVQSHGNSQTVTYGDYICSGEIVDFRNHWYDAPETKVFHSDFVFLDEKDGKMKNMNLYYLVGETCGNAPEGYYYSDKEGRHVKEEEITEE